MRAAPLSRGPFEAYMANIGLTYVSIPVVTLGLGEHVLNEAARKPEEGRAENLRMTMGKAPKSESIVQQFVTKAVRLSAEAIEVEYKDGYEQIFASKHRVGYGIGRLRSSSPEAAALRKELYELAKRRRRVSIGASYYELRGTVFDSFGEDAFHVDIVAV